MQSGGLHFGCLRARDLRGIEAVVEIYENLERRHALRVPLSGDMLLCRHMHASVFRPIAVVRTEALLLRRIGCVTPDVAAAYFPLLDYIQC